MRDATNAATDANMKTRDAVQTILEAFAGFDRDEAASLAGEIDRETRKTCMMIRAAEERCRKTCEEMLTDNPSRDTVGSCGLLRHEMQRFDVYTDEKNHGVPMGAAQETEFWSALKEARKALGAGCSPQMPDGAMKRLIAEVMTRNALYEALDRGAMDERDAVNQEIFVPGEEHRDCTYAAAVLLKNDCCKNKEKDDLTLLVMKVCLVYRLDYLDRGGIIRLDAGVSALMKQRADEAAAAQAEEPQEEDDRVFRIRLFPLCMAGLAGTAAMVLLAPTGIVTGLAAAALTYVFVC